MSECASRMANHLFATVPVRLERAPIEVHHEVDERYSQHFTGNVISTVAANARVACSSRHAKVAHYVPAASPGTNRTIL